MSGENNIMKQLVLKRISEWLDKVEATGKPNSVAAIGLNFWMNKDGKLQGNIRESLEKEDFFTIPKFKVTDEEAEKE